MFKSKFSFKALTAAAVFGASSLIVVAPAQAQSLSDIVDRIRTESNQMSSEDEARVQAFQSDRNEQSARMAQARSELATAEARGNALNAEFDANEAALADLQAQLEAEAGDFGELLGQFRTAAGESMPEIANSFANFEYPGRVDGLAEVAQARSLPTREELDRLPKAMLQEMIAQSEVKAFSAEVAGVGPDGSNAVTEVFRVGVFTAATVDDGKFIEVVDPGSNQPTYLQAFAAQPAGSYRSSLTRLMNASEGDVVRTPVDPSKGNLFGILGDLPTIGKRLQDGGPVGAIILTLLAIGAAIALFKMFTLFTVGGAMRRTAKTKQAGDGNPLARVFEVYETHKNQDLETLELKLDEQILNETPKIERFNDIIKVLAAVAPLLGLLGTVIGMIITFTAITIYGAGDPQLMADGISVALMTTVLGLVAAIPLLVLHAIVSAMSRGAQEILDQQAAGLVAERAERSGAAA